MSCKKHALFVTKKFTARALDIVKKSTRYRYQPTNFLFSFVIANYFFYQCLAEQDLHALNKYVMLDKIYTLAINTVLQL
jgi:hypothetical protein